MATYQEQQWYANDPYFRDRQMELRRQHAKRSYDSMKQQIAKLNEEFMFEEDPNSHVPQDYRNYLLRAFDQIIKDDPNAEANTQTWRKVMQAVITGDPREILRKSHVTPMSQQQADDIQQQMKYLNYQTLINTPAINSLLISGVS